MAPEEGADLPIDPKGNQGDVIGADAATQAVDAGAGTGKTTTMIADIIYRIENENLDPSDVLVLTFANEAAASIREDINQSLPAQQAYAIDVYTYHSFSYELVKDYAYLVDYDPEMEIVTPERQRQVIQNLLSENDYEFADNLGRTDGTPEDIARNVSEFIGSMSREDVSPADIQESFPSKAVLQELTGLLHPIEEFTEEFLTLDEEFIRYFTKDNHLNELKRTLGRLRRLIRDKQERIEEMADGRQSPFLDDLVGYLDALDLTLERLQAHLSLDGQSHKHLSHVLFANNLHFSVAGKIEQTPYGRLSHVLTYVKKAVFFADVYRDYWGYLDREGMADFDGLIRQSVALASESRVAEEIREQWELMYCDEFQDTDRNQFELVTQLSEPTNGPDLVAIGDLDQEIYAWRGTDREGMYRLSDVFDVKYTDLGVNFRSKQEILDLVNETSYGSLETKELVEIDRERGTYNVEDPPDRLIKVESDRIEDSEEAVVADTISKLLTDQFGEIGAKDLGHMAVIVRTNGHAQAVAGELEDRQIPYKISGSSYTSISPGLQTVLSYLRVLANPQQAHHLRRVLIYRYRLPEEDIEALESRSESLFEAVLSASPDEYKASNRLEKASTHLARLSTKKNVYPLSHFFNRFQEITRLDWFLTQEEREDVARIRRYIEHYDPEQPLTTLTEDFVDQLRERLSTDSASSVFSIGSESDDFVDIMTVHQAKGLEFDTVIMPFLSDSGWAVDNDYAGKIAEYRLLSEYLLGELPSLFRSDLSQQLEEEEWRVFHVGATRAESHLIMMGSSYAYSPDEDLRPADVNRTLPRESEHPVEWNSEGKRLDLWENIQQSYNIIAERYPESVADYTEHLVDRTSLTQGNIHYWSQSNPQQDFTREDALDLGLQLGTAVRDETLTHLGDAADAVSEDQRGFSYPSQRRMSALTRTSTRFPADTLYVDSNIELPLTHSYSAVETYTECKRRHYLDHVVRAFDDPRYGTDEGTGATRAGTLFHDIAEEAFYRDFVDKEDWIQAAERIATARDEQQYLKPVKESIDRYFGAEASEYTNPVSEWPMIAAEYPFELSNISGVSGNVIGYIDSLRQAPNGDIVLLDYKRVSERIPSTDASQLRLYLKACRRLESISVDYVGYVYVGSATGTNGRVEVFPEEELPSWEALQKSIYDIDDPVYDDFNPGPHCETCSHRSLGCSPPEFAYDPSYSD